MVMMSCIGCAINFDGVRKFAHETYVCPQCHSGKYVVKMNHPMARGTNLKMCELCNAGVMVKISVIKDPKGKADMDLCRCQNCGNKKAYPKKGD